jgi:hypothetical protein
MIYVTLNGEIILWLQLSESIHSTATQREILWDFHAVAVSCLRLGSRFARYELSVQQCSQYTHCKVSEQTVILTEGKLLLSAALCYC